MRIIAPDLLDELASALQSCTHEKIVAFLQALPEEPVCEAVKVADLHEEIRNEQRKRGLPEDFINTK